MKKTILVFGLLVAMISCKKDNPTPVVTTPTPTPVQISICEQNKVGDLEITNTSGDQLFVFVDNVVSGAVNPYSVKKIESVDSGSHVVKIELVNNSTSFSVYNVNISNCETYKINF